MPTAPADLSTGAHMVAADGRPLPLLGVELRARAEAGLARVILRQQFHNPYAEPLRVRYLVPLPADAAVGGYVFELPDERIVGEIARKHDARERFERALVEGRSAALLEQQRASVFDQEVGNIPPGAIVTTELTIDQPLAWLAEGAWEWRFPTVVAPRYQGAPGQVADAAAQSVPVADGELGAGAALALTIADAVKVQPRSPSHALTSSAVAEGWAVALAGEAGSVALDRDIVVRWGVAAQAPGVKLALARREGDDRAMGLLTIVPPLPTAAREAVARDLILLIDISGSMGGEPLDQAKRVVRALLAGLDPRDRLEMIAFASRPLRWRAKPASCDDATRRDAVAWLDKLHASGGTNMHTAIIEALAPLRDDAQRQILLISDGLIGFEQQIIGEAVRRLPRNSRVHCLGVGHGVNRSLTRPLARAGHGVELIVAPGEDAEAPAHRLLERTHEPLLVGLELEGPALIHEPLLSPSSYGDLFAGAPTRVALACWPEGGRLTVRARSAAGVWEQHLSVPATAPGSGDPALIRHFARERVEDVETLVAAGMAGDGDAKIEELGLRYGIATRMTSWIAVSEQVTVDPTEPSRSVEQPHELPAGMSAEGLGLRAVADAGEPMVEREVIRNEGGVIVGTRGGPRLLGHIKVAKKADEQAPSRPRGRASARKQREERAELPQLLSPHRRKATLVDSEWPAPPPPAARPAAPAPSGPPRESAEQARKGSIPQGRYAPADETTGELPSLGGGGLGGMMPDAAADEAPAPPSPAPAAPRRGSLGERIAAAFGFGKGKRVEATIVVEQDGKLVLAFVTPTRLDWSVPDGVELKVGGVSFRVTIDSAATTKAGPLDAGVTVRVALILAGPLAPGELELELAGLRIHVKR